MSIYLRTWTIAWWIKGIEMTLKLIEARLKDIQLSTIDVDAFTKTGIVGIAKMS